MAWETILATTSIEVGEHTYEYGIIRRGEAPQQSYHIKQGHLYVEIDGKGDDNVATVLGLSQVALLVGAELDTLNTDEPEDEESL